MFTVLISKFLLNCFLSSHWRALFFFSGPNKTSHNIPSQSTECKFIGDYEKLQKQINKYKDIIKQQEELIQVNILYNSSISSIIIIRGVTIHFPQAICIAIFDMYYDMFYRKLTYSLKFMLVEIGTAMFFFYMRSLAY